MDYAAMEAGNRSEFHPWMFEFIQMDILAKAATDYALRVRLGHDEDVFAYWEILKQIYIMLFPYLGHSSREYWKKKNNKVEILIKDWKTNKDNGANEDVSETLIDSLTDHHKEILSTKHFLGFSVPMMKNYKSKEKIKNALLGK